jgi:uncharacterized protein
MTNKHGDFIWYELMTTDADAAAAFYEKILPWTVGNQPDYREIQATEGGIGGILPLTAEMTAGGARPAWVAYINVDDVDKAVTSVEHGGGKVCMSARDLPGIGRFAMVSDPQGAAFYVMKPVPPNDNPDMSSNAFAAERPMDGHCAWNELATSDPADALHFYGVRFGWVKDGDMDMGPMGAYHFIRHGHMVGAVYAKVPEDPQSHWLFYFRVPDIDAGIMAVESGGGRLRAKPTEVPGSGDWSVQACDPQGAWFGLVGKRL